MPRKKQTPIEWKFADGFRARGLKADVAGPELARIAEQAGGMPTAPDIVRAAKPKRSPLHRYFEWDDAQCGVSYRLWQARTLIHSIRIIEDKGTGKGGEPVPLRVYVNVRQQADGRGRSYRAIREVANDEALAAQVMAQAIAELRSWQDRFSDIRKQLSTVFKAIDRVAQRAEKEKAI